MNSNIGYLIHPAIASTLPPTARIADVGTGTAEFLRRLAPAWPNAVLDGYDISATLFPPADDRPRDMHLQLMDARQPVPETLYGKYDLVHVRLLTAGLQASEWPTVVQNLTQLLKPGGALQWEECNFTSVQHLPGRPGATVETARAMGQRFMDALWPQFAHGWDALEPEMKAAGLVRVQKDVIPTDRVHATRERLTVNGMRAIFGWARLVADKGSPGALSMERLEELERQAYKDIQSGCYVRFDVHVAWGFRPEV